VSLGWHVVEANHEGVIFRGPGGKLYPASCTLGKFEYECEEAFDRIRRLPMTPGIVRKRMRLAVREWPNGETSTFEVSFPERLTFGGATETKQGELQGFRVLTPERFRVELYFERNRPPASEFRPLLEAIFGEPAETPEQENDDAEGKQPHQPVPGESGAVHGQGGSGAGEGRPEHRVEQAGGGDPHEPEVRQEVSPKRREILEKFLEERKTKKRRKPPVPSTATGTAGRPAP